MRIAVIGSGGREHAILRRLSQETAGHELFALPGNGGTRSLAQSVPVSVSDVELLHAALKSIRPDLVVVGPEVPLALGIADRLRSDGFACFGPSASAARIESSKIFAKQLMSDHDVPTARFEVFDNFDKVRLFVGSAPWQSGFVVKADGLAAGKGAYVCDNVSEVLDVAHNLLIDDALGAAGQRIIIEERLSGEEVSCMYWCDGESFCAMPVARDYKRVGDGNRGPNTGGMGAHCPAPLWNEALRSEVEQNIIAPVVSALASIGSPFCGVLYAGLMLTERGPMVIEFNCRFGDPETQVILPVWTGVFSEFADACAQGVLGRLESPRPSTAHAVCVVLAANGYPGEYERDIVLKEVVNGESAYSLHAGTVRKDESILSSGGRVLNAIGVGESLPVARARAYELASQLKVPGLFYREDIAAA